MENNGHMITSRQYQKYLFFSKRNAKMYIKLVSFDGSSKIEIKVWKLFISCMWHRRQDQKNLVFGPIASVTSIKFSPGNNKKIIKEIVYHFYVLNNIVNVNLEFGIVTMLLICKKHVLWFINSVIVYFDRYIRKLLYVSYKLANGLSTKKVCL